MRFAVRTSLLLALAGTMAGPVPAECDYVLRQVDEPHNYYWREMYVPQLTHGASSLAWSPDGSQLVYSRGGSLWRQSARGGDAQQLTAGPGYDYQPDWSPDGKTIVYTRYHGDAMELWTLDVATGVQRALTANGAVNLEPRFAPDGSRLAFVSTVGTKRFRIYTASTAGAFIPTPLSSERRSRITRYYYSPYDLELSPAWSPDGTELLYVSNPEEYYGSGSLWRRKLTGGEPVLVRREETSWRAQPDWARDGRRVLWSSYAGRQWHQLWITQPTSAASPLPLTFGDFDLTAARWSPDGQHIAFVSNQSGDGEIWIMDLPGGAKRLLRFQARERLSPAGSLELGVTDEQGREIAARVSVVGSDGRAYAGDGTWMHANECFNRAERSEEPHYFHTPGRASVTLPAGTAQVTVWRGPAHRVEHRSVEIVADRSQRLDIRLASIRPAALMRWQSGDVHVHMNYGGHYRHTPTTLVAQAEAEDLDLVFNTIVNKEERVPDVALYSPVPDPASTPKRLLVSAQEYHTSFWGHLGLLGLRDHLLLPGFVAYTSTGLASAYPDNVAVARLAHDEGALVGYVHPFDPGPEPNSYSIHELPVSAALGAVDYYEAVGFSDPLVSAGVWYRLLNLGFHIAAAGGSDTMANYASLHGPVGLARTYVLADDAGDQSLATRRDAWLKGLAAGRSFATNGPLLAFTLEGQLPGSEIKLPAMGRSLRWSVEMASIASIDHIELIQDGEVAQTIRPAADGRSARAAGTLRFRHSGWVLLRAWNRSDRPEIFDLYPFATTSAIYVTVAGAAQRAGGDARYMLNWLDHIETAARDAEYNSAAERAEVLGNLAMARAVYEAKR